MNKTKQHLIIGLLVFLVILQLIVIKAINNIKLEPKQDNQADVRIPSLDEIDSSMSKWTMLHGQHFSSQSRVSSLESKIDKRLDAIEKQLNSLAAKNE